VAGLKTLLRAGGEGHGTSLKLTANMLMRSNQSELHARIVPCWLFPAVFPDEE
jgi:hypothetical protein